VDPELWLLNARERGNPDTELDARHGARGWSTGNQVRPLVHGSTYFAELLRRLQELRSGDLLLFTDWRGDPDERLAGPGTEVARVFAAAAERGVIVKGLLWRSHLDRLQFSEQENRHLGEAVNRAGGDCVRDTRVRPGGSHHQKLVILRHPGRPELDVAFAGGIDLCHSRNDDATHAGDPQRQGMAAVYGERPPWHDVQLEIRGPAVGQLETCFRERWDDPQPVTRNPFYRLADRLRHDDETRTALPPPLADPAPVGPHVVQVLRTYPARRPGYPFARAGERSVARAYRKVMGRAERLVYLEDQYLWAGSIVSCFARALREQPQLRMIVVVPHYPDQDGRLSMPPNLLGRRAALAELHSAGPGRVAVYGLENPQGTPVYVHAKVCIVDDVWASVGSDNVNRRSWTHDSELSCAVLDETTLDETADAGGGDAAVFAHSLRLQLACEHLDRAPGDDADLVESESAFEAFRASAERLQQWHDAGGTGQRPAGRLRPYRLPPMGRWTRSWATPLYRVIYDPDGRPPLMRWRNEF
jgi:phosphatidylserine/phosphatidylglycerophosphate/cardiolipin synthase-like enzyme